MYLNENVVKLIFLEFYSLMALFCFVLFDLAFSKSISQKYIEDLRNMFL